MKVKSYAKINLCLDILKKEKKYHQILTIFQSIALHDVLTFHKKKFEKFGIELLCGNPDVPLNSNNTIIKAAQALLKNIPAGKQKTLPAIKIHLQKNIPIKSGLGGGSSNAAVTLLTLNKIWNLKLSLKKLEQIAATIGMDVSYFLYGGAASGIHYGEKITKLTPLPKLPLLITTVGSKTGTKNQYESLNLKQCGLQKAQTQKFITALRSSKKISKKAAIHLIKTFAHNDFEQAISAKKWPQINKISLIKKNLLRSGADFVLINGSGPTVMALYSSVTKRDKAHKKLGQSVHAIKTYTL